MAEDEAAADAPAEVMTAVRARVTPATVNAADRTVDVIWSTGARARNRVEGVGVITEELDLSPSAVRMAALASGQAPVFDSHRRGGGARDVIGRVVSARLDGKRGVATLQFSSAADVTPIWQRVEDGTVRTVSVGYRIFKYAQIQDARDGVVHRAVDWEPYEISLAPVPVDQGAVVRGDTAAESPPAYVAIEADPPIAARAAEENPTMAEPATAEPVAPAAAPIVDLEAVRVAAVAADRARMAEVESVLLASVAVLPEGERSALRSRAVSEGLTAEAVRGLAFERLTALAASNGAHAIRASQTVQMGVSGDDPAVIREAMAEAIAVRCKPSFTPAGDRYREWMGVRASDMVRDLMAARGERDIPRNPVLLAERAFHSTSDFPKLLASGLNKVLLSDYAQATPTYRMFMGRRSFNDFRAHSFLRVGDFPTLEALAEGGEIKTGTISEGREQVTMLTYAKGIRVTRQMLINDDLGAFTDFAGMIGRRIVDFENSTAFSVCVTAGSGAGPNLADSAAVFTTGRGNRASSGGAIDITTLGAARQSLRSRTSPDGLKLNLAPRYLLTGPAYETIAWQYASAQYSPATAATTNPFRGVYEPIVDANITGNNWYLFADPAVAPVYIYGFLNGAEGPQVRTTNPPSTDGAVQVDVWLDFGVGAIDWRGGWFNAG